MDYFETINSSKEFELAHANWYYQLPPERKAKIMGDLFQFGLDMVRYNARKENPFITEADQMMKYVYYNLQDKFPADSYQLIENVLSARSEAEWQQRFKAMKKSLGWSYDDMARFIGAASGNSIKASVNRQLPAFAKLAVCVFEQLTKEKKEQGDS